MPGENLQLKIVGTLDTEATKPIINAKISELEGKISKLNLSIKLDDNVTKTLNDFSTQMSKIADIALNTGKVIEKAINPDGSSFTRTYYSGLKGEFSDIATEARQAGDVQLSTLDEVRGGFTKVANEAQKYNSQLEQIAQTTKLINENGTQTRTVKMNGDGGVTNYTDTTNYAKEEQLAQQLTTQQDKLAQSLKNVYNQGYLNEQLFNQYDSSIKASQNVAQIGEIQQALQKQIETEKNLNLQQELVAKSQTLLSSGKIVDVTGVNNLIANLNSLNVSEENATRQLNLMQTELRSYQASTLTAAEETASFGDVLKSVYANMTMYFGGFTLIFQTLSSFKNGISTLNDLNKSLTTISMITHQTQAQVQQLGDQYQQMGQQLSVSTTEIASSATELYRQGLSIDEVNSRLKTITEFSRVAGLSAQDATTYITAATNSMRVSAQQASDTFAALGHSSGVNAGYIATAFQSVGGTAGALGLDFDKVASYIATIGERTKESADTIGNSVKSILARVQSLREKGYDSTDGTTVNQVSKSLATVGIQLVDAQGQFRNFNTVLDELGAKWGSLDNRQKAYIATTVAGTYQQSRFLDLMQGYSRSVQLYNDALNSSGATQQKFNDWQQGTEAQIAKLQNTIQGFWMSVVNSNEINNFLAGVNTIATGFKAVTDGIGLLPTALGIATEAVLLFNTKARTAFTELTASVTTSIKEFGLLNTTLLTEEETFALESNSMGFLSKAMLNLTLAARGTGIAVEFLGTAFKTAFSFVASTMLPVAAIMAVGYAIEKVTQYISDQKQAEADLKTQQDNLVAGYAAHKQQVSDLVDEYDKLSAVRQQNGGLDTADEQKYVDVQNQLAKILPTVTAGVDSKGNAILQSSSAIKDQINLLNEQIRLQKEQQTLAAPKQIADSSSQISDLQKEADKQQQIANTFKDQVKDLVAAHDNHAQILYMMGQENDASLKQANAQNQINTIQQKNADLIKNYFSSSSINSSGITQISSVLSQISLKGKDMGDVDLLFKSISKSVNDLNSALKDDSSNGISKAEKSLKSLGVTSSQVKDILDALKAKTVDNTNATKEAAQAENDYAVEVQKNIDTEMAKATAEEQIVGTTQNLINQSKDLITTYQLLSGQENLSAEQKAALADATGRLTAMYPQFIQNGKLNVEQMRQEAEAEDILLKAVTDVANGHADAEEMMTLNMAMQSKTRLKMISDQIAAYQAEVEAAYAAAEADGGMMTGARANIINNFPSKIADLKNQVDSLTNSYSSQIQHLANITGYQGQFYDSTTKSSTATQNAIYVTDKYKQSMDALNAAISEYSSFQNKYTSDSASYRGVLQKEIDLLKQKEKLQTDQAVNLNHQISSGNVAQTGMINLGSTTSTTSSGGSSTVPSSLSGNSNAQKIWNFLKSAGLTDAAASGIMGNLMQESSLNPNARNPNGAYGLAQWMGGRLTGLQNYASSKGTSSNDLQTQLEWLLKELAFGGNGNISTLNSSASASAAAAYFESTFERSGGDAVANRQNYASQFFNQFKGSGGSSAKSLSVPSTSSSSSQKSASQIAADKAQAIDQAKSDLLNLNQDLVSTRNQIEQLQAEIVQSKIDEVSNSYNTKISDLDQSIKNSQASMQNFVEYSAKWQFENAKQIDLQKQKIQTNIDEENALKKLMSTMSLTADQRAKLSDQIKQLDAATYQYKNDLNDLNFAYYTAQVDMFDKKVADLNNTIKSAQSTMSLYTDNLTVQKQQTLNIVDALNKQISTTQQEIKTIQYAISTTYISEQQKDQLRQKIADLTQSELDYANQVKQANDQLIQQYTTYYNNKAQLDKTALDNEYTAYQNEANKKLALIDKTNNDATYQSGLTQKQKDIKDLQNQINALKLDPTQAGKVADLQKQLAQDQTDLSDYIKQHDIQNQKDAINADVTSKKNSIDQQKTQVDSYYNSLIQFQTQYLQTSEKMTNEHLDKAKGAMAKIASYIQTMFVNVGKSMDVNVLNKFNNLLNAFNKAGGVNAKTSASFWSMLLSASGMKSFDTGGYTGSGEGLAYLHSKEIILNKDDTSNFLQAVDISRQFAGMMSKLSNATNLPAQNGVSINMPITIQSLNGTKEGVNDFFNIINSKLRSKGGLTLA